MFYVPHKTALPGGIVEGELSAALTFGPNLAVLVMSLGIFGIYAEFCRPGRVIPGALGSALFLLGLASLLRFPLASSALLCLLIAAAILGMASIFSGRGVKLPGLFTLPAACAAILGLRTLIDAPDPALHIRWATACCTAVPLTLATSFLLSAAMAARRVKASIGVALPGGTIS